jgi:hypothetical protein
MRREFPTHVARHVFSVNPVTFVANHQAAIFAVELPCIGPFIDIKDRRTLAASTSGVSSPRLRTRIACGAVFPFLAEKFDEMLAAGAEILTGERAGRLADFTGNSYDFHSSRF